MNTCIICAASFTKSRASYRSYPLCSQQCFTANFWLEKVVWHHNGDKTEDGRRVARINGEHYILGVGKGLARGYGGRRFEIIFNTGETVICNDLWSQGTIPPAFKEVLQDNARWKQ